MIPGDKEKQEAWRPKNRHPSTGPLPPKVSLWNTVSFDGPLPQHKVGPHRKLETKPLK